MPRFNSEDYWQEDRFGKIKMPALKKPKSFIERMHRGEFGKGFPTLVEARMHRRRGLVVLPAEDGCYYIVSVWASMRYGRYVDGRSQK